MLGENLAGNNQVEDLENGNNLNAQQIERLQQMMHQFMILAQQQQQQLALQNNNMIQNFDNVPFEDNRDNEGTNCDLVIGLIMGYAFDFIGVLSVFCCNFTK